MTTAELITKLQTMPPTANVGYVWDGCVRSTVEVVWLTKSGEVALADYGDTVYTFDCPVDFKGNKYTVR